MRQIQENLPKNKTFKQKSNDLKYEFMWFRYRIQYLQLIKTKNHIKIQTLVVFGAEHTLTQFKMKRECTFRLPPHSGDV